MVTNSVLRIKSIFRLENTALPNNETMGICLIRLFCVVLKRCTGV